MSANVATVKDFRGTPSTGVVVVSNTYQRLPAGTGPWRVTQQQNFHGASHTLAYTFNGSSLTQVEYTSPRLTKYSYAVDGYKRPTSLTVTPSSQFGGKPRSADNDEPEPTSLTYQFFYQSGCPCPLLSKIVYPSGMAFEYTWDLELARLTSMTVPRPSGLMGTVTYTWTYHDFEHFGQPITYTPPAGGASLTFNYAPPSLPGWSTRAGGLWGPGRALEKHGSRPGSVFPRASGNVAAKNAQGQAALDDILGNVGRTSPNKFGGLDYFGGSRGAGARFDGQGNFIGFLEP